MKIRHIVCAGGLLAFGLASRPGLTQSSILPFGAGPPVQARASLIIPASVDPDTLTFFTNGQVSTKTDSGNPITGRLLTSNVNPPPPSGAGLVLQGHVQAISTGPDIPVVEMDFNTTYTGALEIDTLVDPSFPGFTPWFLEAITPLPGYAQAFRAFKTLPTQAGLALDQNLYGFFSVQLADPTDPSGFLNSTFAIAGFTSVQPVPEPGAMALLMGMAAGGGLLWRSRRKNAVP